MSSNEELINIVKEKSTYYLDDKERSIDVIQAMLAADRQLFLPQSVKKLAYQDTPLPIGYNQTCSQPSMVAFMLDKLEIKKGLTILEIGAGCGYAAAVASLITGPKGKVYTSEIIPELAHFAQSNLNSYENVELFNKDGSPGFPEYAPFDRIFISAGVASSNFSENILLNQLSDDGILLYPECFGNIYKLKKENGNIIKEIYHGVSFVSLKGINS